MARKTSLKKQAKEIIRIAQEGGVQSNYFFLTTFEQLEVKLKVLDRLQDEIENNSLFVERERIKGETYEVTNPAISEYCKTSDSANKTITTLLRIIKDFNVKESKEDADPLMKILNGGEE